MLENEPIGSDRAWRSTVIGRSSARDTPPNSLTDDDSVERATAGAPLR